MKPFMEEIKCHVLSANIKPDKTLAPTFGAAYQPYKIFDVSGEKVGVVGYTSQETPALSQPGKWRWTVYVSGISQFASKSVLYCLRSRLKASTL